MQFRKTLFTFLVVSLFGVASANTITVNDIQTAFTKVTTLQTPGTEALINWKVGDAQEFNVSAGLGFSGTMKKEATREEGNGIWVKQNLDMGFIKDNSEMLIDRDTGEIKKFLRNGKPAEIPKNDMEITEMNNSTVSVPAYSGKALHIVGKSKDIKRFEAWMNNQVLPLDGSAKLFIDQGQMKITMELTKYTKN